MLQNKPSVTGPVAKFGFDTAENELSEVEISTIFWRSFWWSRDEKKVSPKIGDFWRRTLSPLSWRGSVIFLRRMTFSQSSTEKAGGPRLGRSSRRSWSHTSRRLREFGWVRCPLALNLVFSSSSWQAYSKPNHRSGIVFMHRAAWSFRRLPRAKGLLAENMAIRWITPTVFEAHFWNAILPFHWVHCTWNMCELTGLNWILVGYTYTLCILVHSN